MRLKITFTAAKIRLPIAYQQVLQGVIYKVFSGSDYGTFLHDEGYKVDDKTFKFFNFSNLYGNYSIKKDMIEFYGDVYFYVSSMSEGFIRKVYEHFYQNKVIRFYNQEVDVIALEAEELPSFDGIVNIKVKTLSPVVAYVTFDDYTKYVYPKDNEFETLCFNNLCHKAKYMDIPVDSLVFQINEVSKIKKRVVKFKNTFYIGYMCEIDMIVNYPVLSLLYNTGLSAKGSSGFGMIEIMK